jgi:hypothetical protein
MLRNTLMTLSVSAMLGTAVIAPNVALAFGPPPLGLGGPPRLGPGGPPGLGLGGHPPGLGLRAPSGVGRGGPPGLARSGPAELRGAARSGGHAYGRSGGRDRHGGHYGVAVYGDGDSYGSDGCYYASSGRRVAVCDDN